MKKCTRCQRPKADSEFYKSSANKGGLQNYCKKCSRLASKKYDKRQNRDDMFQVAAFQSFFNPDCWQSIHQSFADAIVKSDDISARDITTEQKMAYFNMKSSYHAKSHKKQLRGAGVMAGFKRNYRRIRSEIKLIESNGKKPDKIEAAEFDEMIAEVA